MNDAWVMDAVKTVWQNSPSQRRVLIPTDQIAQLSPGPANEKEKRCDSGT
jgi:hypothetical protein